MNNPPDEATRNRADIEVISTLQIEDAITDVRRRLFEVIETLDELTRSSQIVRRAYKKVQSLAGYVDESIRILPTTEFTASELMRSMGITSRRMKDKVRVYITRLVWQGRLEVISRGRYRRVPDISVVGPAGPLTEAPEPLRGQRPHDPKRPRLYPEIPDEEKFPWELIGAPNKR